jgi:hypothetical protein
MSTASTSDESATTPITASFPVWCRGCRSVQPVAAILRKVDSCYRVRQQCGKCITKSTKHYHAHRAGIRAAREMRQQDCERVACVCGLTINVKHREKQYHTKRH